MYKGRRPGCRGEEVLHCSCAEPRIEKFMEPCLLLLLREKPSHGYDLIRRLSDFGFAENQDPGLVYRNLRSLEERGMIVSEWDTSGAGPARRLYQLTPEGQDFLDAWAEAVRINVEVLQMFLRRYEAGFTGKGEE